MNHYTIPDGDGKAVPKYTPTEAAIHAIHGDSPHNLIIALLNEGKTHREIAAELSDKAHGLSLSIPWVSGFIRRNYRKHERWERV